MENRKSGFTLIEVLMVVGIIALLIIVSIGTYRKQLDKGNDGRRKTDIRKIQVALEEYEKDHDCYPTIEVLECTPGDKLKPYLNKIPCERNSTMSYYYYPELDAECPKWYWIFSDLENTGDRIITDLGCQEGCGPTQNNVVYNYYARSPNADTPYKSYAPNSDYYGCFSGVCREIGWYPATGKYDCYPNYIGSDCGGGEHPCVGAYGESINECVK